MYMKYFFNFCKYSHLKHYSHLVYFIISFISSCLLNCLTFFIMCTVHLCFCILVRYLICGLV